jgi:hypothetical protein
MGMTVTHLRTESETKDKQVEVRMVFQIEGLDVSSRYVEPEDPEDEKWAIEDAVKEYEQEVRKAAERIRPEMPNLIGFSAEGESNWGELKDPKSVKMEMTLIAYYDIPITEIETEIGKLQSLLS